MIVPNRFPTIPATHRIAIVGEAPGKDEALQGQPFVGASGRFLAAILAKAGVVRDSCFLGNICQHQPNNNDISTFSWNGDEIQHGLLCLKNDIEKFNPNIVVLLGNVALKAAKDCGNPHALKPKAYRFKNSNLRGTLFRCLDESSPLLNRKCLSTYHPAYVLRDYASLPLLMFDIKRGVKEGYDAKLDLPQRSFFLPSLATEVIHNLTEYRVSKLKTAIDIEGWWNAMSCISFSNNPLTGFVIPFTHKDGSYIWSQSDGLLIWRALATFLEDPTIPKVFQNGLYDRFVLQYGHRIRVQGTTDDTMLSGWEVYCELEKGLAVQTSIWTREPFYKGERKSLDDDTFYTYCIKDSQVTLEISNEQAKVLSGTSLTHYQLNVSLQNPLLYMELRGMAYDSTKALERRQLLQHKLYVAQAKLNHLTQHSFFPSTTILTKARSVMCYVRNPEQPKKDYVEAYARIQTLLAQEYPSLATMGEVDDLLETSLNVGSKSFQGYLYEVLKLPVQYNENETGVKVPTADYEALLRLSAHVFSEPDSKAAHVLRLAIEIRALQTRQGMLSINSDSDGRIRCGYNIVGSETGRITCYTSPTGSGYNLQTIPNYTNSGDAPGGVLGDRDLFPSDSDHWFFQCDLKGADGWTVAAYAAMLGDRTMLDDYLFGLKPANILCLMLRGVKGDFSNRDWLKAESKKVNKDSWDYFACKRVQHGAAYMEGGLTISRNILKDSEGKLTMTQKECNDFKKLFFARYPGIRLWHDWITRRLSSTNGIPTFIAASGQVRKFFGRPDEIATKVVAHEPQANTTYATNLAMYRLWTDPENRESSLHRELNDTRRENNGGSSQDSRISLRIEPLHQVHDALVGQFKKTDTPWAINKIQQWFDNPLQIAGQRIIIPFDGAYGTSWGDLKEGTI